jgi:hypothetical protein
MFSRIKTLLEIHRSRGWFETPVRDRQKNITWGAKKLIPNAQTKNKDSFRHTYYL